MKNIWNYLCSLLLHKPISTNRTEKIMKNKKPMKKPMPMPGKAKKPY